MLSDSLWQVIADTLRKYKGVDVTDDHRRKIEETCEFQHFDGGVVVTRGPEMDIFVLPERQRGRWRIRSVCADILQAHLARHGRAVAHVDSRNQASLRLVMWLGFCPIGSSNGVIALEKR